MMAGSVGTPSEWSWVLNWRHVEHVHRNIFRNRIYRFQEFGMFRMLGGSDLHTKNKDKGNLKRSCIVHEHTLFVKS